MIIRFLTKEQHPRDAQRVIYWFDVKLPVLAWTDICVGFDENENLVSASKTFYELDADLRNEIIANTQRMVKKVMA